MTMMVRELVGLAHARPPFLPPPPTSRCFPSCCSSLYPLHDRRRRIIHACQSTPSAESSIRSSKSEGDGNDSSDVHERPRASGGDEPSDGSSERTRTATSVADEASIASILAKVDQELEARKESNALAIISTASGLRGFGAATQVPQRIYSIADLRLNNIDTTRFLSPVDNTLGEVRRNLQIAAAFGGIVVWQTMGLSQFQVLGALLALTVISGIDLVANNGGIEALLTDSLGRLLSEKYRNRVAQHEAGHFLIAYLLGVLPKSYTLSSLEAFMKEGSFNMQAGTTFVDVEFQEEVKSGKLSSMTLNKYSCIALAGVATEYLLFGLAEGGLSDIQQLDNLLKSLNFTQKKADSQVRWAVLNTVTILRRHIVIITKLAAAMAVGNSVGQCIQLIEMELVQASQV